MRQVLRDERAAGEREGHSDEDSENCGRAAEDSTVGQDDAPQLRRRSAADGDERQFPLPAAGSDREGRPGQQDDLQDAEAATRPPSVNVRRRCVSSSGRCGGSSSTALERTSRPDSLSR